MTRHELLDALQRLGELIPQKAQIGIAGGAALILGEVWMQLYLEQGADGDVQEDEAPDGHSRGGGPTRGGP